MSLKILAFLISHATLTDVNIWQYPSTVVQASSAYDKGRHCPVAEQFMASGLDAANVPLTMDRKIGSMVTVEKDGQRYVISLRGDSSYTHGQLKKAKSIFLENE